MAAELYRVVFKGQLAANAVIDEVTTNLTALYRNNSAKADAILSSNHAVIKKDLELATCQKIQNAFKKAGVICSIEKQELESHDLDNLTMESPDMSASLAPPSPSEDSQDTPTLLSPSQPPELPNKPEKQQTVHAVDSQSTEAKKPPTIKRPDEKYCRHCGKIIKMHARTCSHCGVQVGKKLSKGVLLLITFFIGGLGGHKFYVGKTLQGAMYLVFFWTTIPGFMALIEFVIYALTKEENLQDKYPDAGGKEVVIILLVLGFVGVIASIGILAAIAIPNFISYRNKAYFAQIEKELNELATQQELYYATHDKYAISLDELGITSKNDNVVLEIMTTEKDCFVAKGSYAGTSKFATMDCKGTIVREGLEEAKQGKEETFSQGKTFTSEEGNFSISFPGEPTESSQEVGTALGPITIILYIYETKNGAYIVSYSDYPPEIIEQSDPDVLLSEAQSGAVGNVNGEVIKSEDIYIATYPGIEIVFKIPRSERMPPGGMSKARFYLVDNRLYQIISIHGGSKLSEAMDQFLESFQLMYE